MHLTLHIAGRHILTIGDPPHHDDDPGEELDWTITSTDLTHLLDRAHHGEEPGALLIELYANADHTG